MPVEDDPKSPSPSERPAVPENWEMSFAGVLRSAVDTLFTYRPIMDRLRDAEGDEQMEAFANQRRLVIIGQLEQTAMAAVDDFLADLDSFQPGRHNPSSLPDQRPDVDKRVE